MDTIDLHGYKHEEISGAVHEFVHLYEPPFRIITGNSGPIQQIVFKILKKNDYLFYNESDYNLGSFIVIKV